MSAMNILIILPTVFSPISLMTVWACRGILHSANSNPASYDLGLCKQPGLASILPKSIELSSLCGAFKVPTLRNVAVTGPYYHNGEFTSLRDAVKFYATRDTDPGRWYPKRADGKTNKFDDLPEEYKSNVNMEEAPYDRKLGQRPRLNDREVDALGVPQDTPTRE